MFGLNTGTRLERSELDHAFVPFRNRAPEGASQSLGLEIGSIAISASRLSRRKTLPIQIAMRRFDWVCKPTFGRQHAVNLATASLRREA